MVQQCCFCSLALITTFLSDTLVPFIAPPLTMPCWNFLCRIWDYDADEVVNTFENHNNSEKGVSKLCLLNELDDSLLLVASSKLFVYLSCIPITVACDPYIFKKSIPITVACDTLRLN